MHSHLHESTTREADAAVISADRAHGVDCAAQSRYPAQVCLNPFLPSNSALRPPAAPRDLSSLVIDVAAHTDELGVCYRAPERIEAQTSEQQLAETEALRRILDTAQECVPLLHRPFIPNESGTRGGDLMENESWSLLESSLDSVQTPSNATDSVGLFSRRFINIESSSPYSTRSSSPNGEGPSTLNYYQIAPFRTSVDSKNVAARGEGEGEGEDAEGRRGGSNWRAPLDDQVQNDALGLTVESAATRKVAARGGGKSKKEGSSFTMKTIVGSKDQLDDSATTTTALSSLSSSVEEGRGEGGSEVGGGNYDTFKTAFEGDTYVPAPAIGQGKSHGSAGGGKKNGKVSVDKIWPS